MVVSWTRGPLLLASYLLCLLLDDTRCPSWVEAGKSPHALPPPPPPQCRKEWDDLFLNSNYLARIRQAGINGRLRSSRFRSVCWKVTASWIKQSYRVWLRGLWQIPCHRKEKFWWLTDFFFSGYNSLECSSERASDFSKMNSCCMGWYVRCMFIAVPGGSSRR